MPGGGSCLAPAWFRPGGRPSGLGIRGFECPAPLGVEMEMLYHLDLWLPGFYIVMFCGPLDVDFDAARSHEVQLAP